MSTNRRLDARTAQTADSINLPYTHTRERFTEKGVPGVHASTDGGATDAADVAHAREGSEATR